MTDCIYNLQWHTWIFKCVTDQIKSFKSVQIYMKDAECVETNEKSIFRFWFFELWSFLYSKQPQFSMNFHDNSKNKNQKIDFSFDSVHYASFITTWAKLRGGRLHNLSWEIPINKYIWIQHTVDYFRNVLTVG